MARKRARWKARQGSVNIGRLVFIDETWAKTNMAPLRGWSLRGQRLEAKVPFGHWKTMTFIAALRHDRIDAPWVVNGPVNAEIFLTYIETQLVPTLSLGRDRRGATALEYAIIGALLAIIITTSIRSIGTSSRTQFSTIASPLQKGNLPPPDCHICAPAL